MFIIIVFDKVFTRSSADSLQDFFFLANNFSKVSFHITTWTFLYAIS